MDRATLDEIYVELADALDYVIETSKCDTTRFVRARTVLAEEYGDDEHDDLPVQGVRGA